MKEDLLKIIKHYGISNQLRKFNEECFELEEAIMFDFNDEYSGCKENREHITEEIADCLVMLKQFQFHYKINREEIRKIMNFKIER